MEAAGSKLFPGPPAPVSCSSPSPPAPGPDGSACFPHLGGESALPPLPPQSPPAPHDCSRSAPTHPRCPPPPSDDSGTRGVSWLQTRGGGCNGLNRGLCTPTQEGSALSLNGSPAWTVTGGLEPSVLGEVGGGRQGAGCASEQPGPGTSTPFVGLKGGDSGRVSLARAGAWATSHRNPALPQSWGAGAARRGAVPTAVWT